MSSASPRGVLVFGGASGRRAEVARELRLGGAMVPVRVASQMAEAMKCLADGAVQCVVVLDDHAAAEQLRVYRSHVNREITVHDVTTAAELQRALHDMTTQTKDAIDRP